MDVQLIPSLFFLNSNVTRDNSLYDYDICMALTDVIQNDELNDFQRIETIWRVYTNTHEVWVKLSVNGIDATTVMYH